MNQNTAFKLGILLSAMDERLKNQEQTLSAQAQLLVNQGQPLCAQGQLLARIHESLEHDPQRVNLNVRAPKRPAPDQRPTAGRFAGVGGP